MNRWIMRLITCMVAVILVIIATYTDFVKSFDKNVEDALYHHAGNVDANIKIIKIDDKTMNKLGDFSTWNRDIYTKLVETLCASEEIKPAVIGFDVLFSSEKDTEMDNRFADVCSKYNNIVTGFAYVFKNEYTYDENGRIVIDGMVVEQEIMPYDALRQSTEKGFVNAQMNQDDGVIRNSFIYFDEEDGHRELSFSAKVYEIYMMSQGIEVRWPTDEATMGFRYSGMSNEYEMVSLIDVLDGTVPAETFDDCIVLVGAYAAGMMDAYFVPVDKSTQMYGVEIHANVIQALIEDKTLEIIPLWLSCFFSVIIVIALILFCERLSLAKIIALCGFTGILKLIVGFFVFNAGYSANVLVVPVMSVVIAVYYIIIHYYKARKIKKNIESAFSKYVAPQIVDEISKEGTYELKLGGENRNVAVLFVDIRGFTTLSESMEPEQVVDILNGYLALTTECVFRHGGTLDKFIGDATMAVFNSPFDTDDYVYRAILTAWDIVKGGSKIEKEYYKKYGKHVGFGVGVNCGPAVVGNIGSDFRMDYTAIGDTVNTAARLEANAPRDTVYISEYVYEVVKDRVQVEKIGEIPLKGKSKGVFVYSVTGVKGYVSPNEG